MNGLEFSMSLASSNLIDYFVDSNTAGKIVIVFGCDELLRPQSHVDKISRFEEGN